MSKSEFSVDDKLRFKSGWGEVFDNVNFRGYNGKDKAVIVGPTFGQMEVKVDELELMPDTLSNRPQIEYEPQFVRDQILDEFLVALDKKGQLSTNPMSDSELVYKNLAIVQFHRFDMKDRKEVELKHLQSLKPTEGGGGKALNDIVSVADQLGYKLILYAKPYGTNPKYLKARPLVKFYEKAGFVVDYASVFEGEFKTKEELLKYVDENPEQGVPMVREPKIGLFKETKVEPFILGPNGKPLVVYHGSSTGGIVEFDPLKNIRGSDAIGTWFTDSDKIASKWARNLDNNGFIYSANLVMSNPWLLKGDKGFEEYVRIFKHKTGLAQPSMAKEKDILKFREYLKMSGKDGIIITGMPEAHGHDYYMVLDNNQINNQSKGKEIEVRYAGYNSEPKETIMKAEKPKRSLDAIVSDIEKHIKGATTQYKHTWPNWYRDTPELRVRLIEHLTGKQLSEKEATTKALKDAFDEYSLKVELPKGEKLFQGISFAEYVVLSGTRGYKPAFRSKHFLENGVSNFQEVRADLVVKGFLKPNTAITPEGTAKLKEVLERVGRTTTTSSIKDDYKYWKAYPIEAEHEAETAKKDKPKNTYPKTVRQAHNQEVATPLMLSRLELGDKFKTGRDRNYEVTRKTKPKKVSYVEDKHNGSYMRTTVTIKDNGGRTYTYELWDDWVQNGNKMIPIISGKGQTRKKDPFGQLSREIDGDLLTDLINENNMFHDKSDSWKYVQKGIEALQMAKAKEVEPDIDIQKVLDNAEYKLIQPEYKSDNGEFLIRLPIQFVIDNTADEWRVTRGSSNEIKGRIDKAKEHLKTKPTKLEPSLIAIGESGRNKGKVEFQDGRHRLVAAQELGAKYAWFAIRATVRQINALAYLFSEFGNVNAVSFNERTSIQGNNTIIQTSDNSFVLTDGHNVIVTTANESGGFDGAKATRNGKRYTLHHNDILAIQDHVREYNPESNKRNIQKFLDTKTPAKPPVVITKKGVPTKAELDSISTDEFIDTRPGNYYVTVIDAGNVYPILGPFKNNHKAALDSVEKMKRLANDKATGNDMKIATWGRWGTSRMDRTKAGTGNAIFKAEYPKLIQPSGSFFREIGSDGYDSDKEYAKPVAKRTRRTKAQISQDNYNADVDDYKYYVVELANNRVVSGYESKADAEEYRLDFDVDENGKDQKEYKTVAKATLSKMGIENPNQKWKSVSSQTQPDKAKRLRLAQAKAKALKLKFKF